MQQPHHDNHLARLKAHFELCLRQQDFIGAELIAEGAPTNGHQRPTRRALSPALLTCVNHHRPAICRATTDPALEPEQRTAAARLLCGIHRRDRYGA